MPADIENILEIDPPVGDQVERIEFIAKALAYGVINDLWTPYLEVEERWIKDTETPPKKFIVKIWDKEQIHQIPPPLKLVGQFWKSKGHPSYEENLSQYLNSKWDFGQPQATFLEAFGYLERKGEKDETVLYLLTPAAFALLKKPKPSSIFISYKRSESSALALLIVARMKEHGLTPFLDMHPDTHLEDNRLNIAEDWENELRQAIDSREYMVALISPKSLAETSFVRTELRWAIESPKPKKIIPIWHGGFKEKHLPDNLDLSIRDIILKKNAIKVEAENPKQYNAALDELLSVFSILP